MYEDLMNDIDALVKWGIRRPLDEFGVCTECFASWFQKHSNNCRYREIVKIVQKYDPSYEGIQIN